MSNNSGSGNRFWSLRSRLTYFICAMHNLRPELTCYENKLRCFQDGKAKGRGKKKNSNFFPAAAADRSERSLA
jgi:hypothetical protein